MSDLRKLSKDELAEITLRLLKATEGNWMPSPATSVLGSGVVSAPQGRVVAMGVASDDDAEFIASAHADVEHLLDHITAMEAEQRAAASCAAGDAFEVGHANATFIEQQTARIQLLEGLLKRTLQPLGDAEYDETSSALITDIERALGMEES